MPKQYTYTGEPQNIGRFGDVKPGDVLDLYVDEEIGILEREDFEPASGPAKPIDVALKGTPAFDLRILPWDDLRRLQFELGEYTQNRLSTLVAAMNLIGVPVDYFDSTPPRDVVDDVIRAGRSAGWHKLTREERHACGVFSEEDQQEEAPAAEAQEEAPTEEPQEEEAEDAQQEEAEPAATEETSTAEAQEEETEEAPPTQPKTRRGRKA